MIEDMIRQGYTYISIDSSAKSGQVRFTAWNKNLRRTDSGTLDSQWRFVVDVDPEILDL